MAFLALLIGVVLLVAAIRDTHTDLFTALKEDVPGFAVWGAAILGLAAIGFVPGLKPVSRGLLALVITVLILVNYKQILAGFASVSKGQTATGSGTGGTSGGSSASSLSSILGNQDPAKLFELFSQGGT